MNKKKVIKIFVLFIVLILLVFIVSSLLSSSEIDKARSLEEKGNPEAALYVYKNLLLNEPTNEIAFEKILKDQIKNEDFDSAENTLTTYYDALKNDENKFGETEELGLKKGLYFKLRGLYHVGYSLNIKTKYERVLEVGKAISALEASLRYKPNDQSVKELLSTIKTNNLIQ